MKKIISVIPQLKRSKHFAGRKSWVDYFMAQAFLAAEQSTCLRRKVGAVAVKEKRIIATGFNGQVSGTVHCKKCLREELGIPSGQRQEICRALHAEQNVLIQCAKYGPPIKGAIIYQTTKPCITCFKMLLNAGVESIIYEHDYPDEFTNIEMSTCGWMKIKREDNFFCLQPRPEFKFTVMCDAQ